MNILAIADSIVSKLRRHANQTAQTENYVEKVEGDLYTTRQGFSLIAQRMADEITQNGAKSMWMPRWFELPARGTTFEALSIAWESA